MNLKLWRNLTVGILLSAFFIWLAFRDLDWQAAAEIVENIDWGRVPILIVVFSISLLIRGVRWYFLTNRQVSLRASVHLLNISMLINSTLPFRAGDLARAYFVPRTGSKLSAWGALSTIVTERLLDMVALLVLLAAVFPILKLSAEVVAGGLLLGSAALVGFIVLLVFASHPDWPHAILKRVENIIPVVKRLNLAVTLDRVLEGLKPLTTVSMISQILLWTAVVWIITIGEAWSVSLLFPNLQPTLIIYASMILALVGVSFSVIVPFTPAAIGPFEAATIFGLMAGGVSHEMALTFAVLWHVSSITSSVVWGLIGLAVLGLSPKQVRQGMDVFNSTRVEGAEVQS